MRVSIVVNNFNYERFLGEAIQSALAQTHPDAEVIVVDDGSTDGSRAVIAEFGGRVRPVLQDNRGQAGAFNAGSAASSGELVIFLDADDLLLPGAAAAAAQRAAVPGISQIHWPLTDIDAAGVPTGATTPGEPLADGDLLEDLLSDGPLQWSSPPTSGNAWPRDYLAQVLPIPEDRFPLAADAYLMAVAPLYGRLCAIASSQACYRRHGGNSWAGTYDEIAFANRRITRTLLPVVVEHAVRRGFEVDVARWERRSYDLNLAASLEDLDAIVGRATPFVLVDGQQLGMDSSSGRPVTPFLERDGEYWGEPADDEEAIAELERMRAEGQRFLVLAWPVFWWTEHYAGFIAHLRERYRCRLESDHLVIFELTGT